MGNIFKFVFGLFIIVSLTGCAVMNPGNSPDTFGSNEILHSQNVYLGTVISLRTVKISRAAQGNAIGGIAGGGAGAGIGAAVGGRVGAIVGGVVGLIGGSIIGGQVDHESGYLITVKLQNGNLVAVTQQTDIKFQVGERVQIIESVYSTSTNPFGGVQSQVIRVEPFN